MENIYAKQSNIGLDDDDDDRTESQLMVNIHNVMTCIKFSKTGRLCALCVNIKHRRKPRVVQGKPYGVFH